MKRLTREEILDSNDLPFEEMEIKEWDGTIRVRGLTAAERDDFEANIFTGEGKARKFNYSNLRARLLAITICDENNERLFTDADIEKLGKKNARILDRAFIIAQRLSGIGQTDLDDLLKNSEGTAQD